MQRGVKSGTMKKQEVDAFEALEGQLASLYEEMQTLVKKSPNDLMNKFKLQLVNSILQRVNEMLGAQRRPFPDFCVFDQDVLPSNSDVLVIVSQYLSSMEELRAANIHQVLGAWYWIVTDDSPARRAAPPRRLRK